ASERVVVHHRPHVGSEFDEPFGQVAADETAGTGDEDFLLVPVQDAHLISRTSSWACWKSSCFPMSSQYSTIGKLATQRFSSSNFSIRSVMLKRSPGGISRRTDGSSR